MQYAELMDFCFAWLRKLVGNKAKDSIVFNAGCRRITVNVTEGRDLAHFTEGMARVSRTMALALKPGAPLAFTYHHNKLEAYHAIAVAILDAGLTCSGEHSLSGRDGRLNSYFGNRLVDYRDGVCVPRERRGKTASIFSSVA